MLAAIRGALTTLFPVTCAGCGAPDCGVCASCRAALRAECHPQVMRLGEVPVAAALDYDERVRALAHAYKEAGRVDVASVLGPLLRASLLALLRTRLGEDACTAVRAAAQDAGPGSRSSAQDAGPGDRAGLPGVRPGRVLLVPVPSRPAARARRGFDHVELLITRAVRARPVRALTQVRRVRDQAGLGRDARHENLTGALRAHRLVRGRTCILIDDFMTTGATLSEAARALNAVGARVLGAAVVARVPVRHPRP